MFSATLRRLAEAAKSAPPTRVLNVHNNPYKSRKVWPPNFEKLSPQQQLRFEKKYKRRIFLASHSPKWDKGARLLQWGMISGMSQGGIAFGGASRPSIQSQKS